MNLTGKIKYIGVTETVSDKFKKREIVITDNSNDLYPQHIIMQATQDKCAILDRLTVGDNVVAYFNLKGREWTSPQGEIKYFNTLEVWKCEIQEKANGEYVPQVAGQNTFPNGNISDDSLPF